MEQKPLQRLQGSISSFPASNPQVYSPKAFFFNSYSLAGEVLLLFQVASATSGALGDADGEHGVTSGGKSHI